MEVVAAARALSPNFAQNFDELVAALRDGRREIDAEELGILLGLAEGIQIVWENLEPRENQLHDELEEFNDGRQVGRTDRNLHRQQ